MRLAAIMCLALAGCGVVYTAPSVREAAGTDYDVAVVPLTYETAAAANLVPYVPARLPLAFQPGAAAKVQAVRAVVPALDALPEPSVPRTVRPNFIADAFPPLGEPQSYRIGIADVLLLSVSGPVSAENLPALITSQAKRQGYVVQDDGAIAVPDAGRVVVAGLTMQEAEAEIFRALVAARIDPSFSLEISEFNSQRVSVGGEVGAPALVPVTLKPLYLHEAVQLAGGVTVTDPKTAKVQLFRGGETYQIGLERFLADPAAQRIVLRDGDSIYVGSEYREQAAQVRFQQELELRNQQIEATQFRLQQEQIAAQITAQREANAQASLTAERELFEKRLALGAVEQAYAYRAGEVRAPGRLALPFERSAKLADLLFGEGGMNIEKADYAEIYVLRAATDPAQTGGLTAYHLDAENAANLSVATQFEIRPNDVVFVTEQPITSWNRVVSQMVPQLFLSAANLATN